MFVRSSRDALGNVVTVEQFDYRVLAPREIRDPNDNYRAVAFDVMGMPVAAAVMGKQRTESGDSLDALPVDLTVGTVSGFLTTVYNQAVPEGWLGTATARYVYDFGANVAADGTTTYLHRPASACGIVRERHVQSGGATDIQVGLEYSDGMGAVLVKKSQAEPDPDSPLANPPLRWIASGKTVLNNKGKPVKQYEPYFSLTEHRFDPAEAAAEIGVTPLMYYDAAGRLVRTELPDGTLSRVELSPWHVRTFDANDTVLESAWYQGRGAPSATEPLAAGASPNTRAAWLATKHAGTPAETILDSLGRAVVAVAHNRVADGAGVVRDERYVTFTRLDAEGKPLWIRDPLAHLVMQYLWPPKPDNDDPRIVRNFSPTGNPNNDIGARTPAYDIAGNLLFQHSMDAGNRWMINDAAGKPMFAWDINERQDANNAFVTEQRVYATAYDRLHRPRATWLRVNDGTATMIERFEYQDARPNDVNNLNGQLVRRYDPSGRTETVRRDFDGNVREARRRLNNRPREASIDWSVNPVASLEVESFAQITEFDALNRMTRQFHWHREAAGSPVTSHEPTYNERGALFSESLTTRLVKSAAGIRPGPNTTTTPAIEQIRYNEKGQKTFLALGNGTLTQYEYDRETFRLVQIQTTRPSDPAGFPTRRSNLIDPVIVQQLLYAYDPVGNVTECRDDAYEPVYFQNQQVEPRSRYEYDALYRLTRATGRENGALRGAPAHVDGRPVDANFPILDTDPNALRIYTQTYRYDAAGNIQRVRHDAGLGSWTRDYAYAFEDPAQPASNRLWQTWVGGNRAQAVTYSHDTHGNMRKLAPADPRFNLRWDHRDMLRSLDLGGGGRAYYQYDADKQRTRKRIDGQNGLGGHWERIYLAGYELYRRYGANGNAIVEEIESHHLFEGEQRVLLVDDVIRSSGAANPRPDGLVVRRQTLFRYQYGNHLGSACLELDEDRRLVSYEEYHPYGTSAYRAMKRGIEAPPKRYRYTGMERDEESGLNYHGARYYAVWMARWISCDPLGIRATLNGFAYGRDNPLSFVDPNGEGDVKPDYGWPKGSVCVSPDNTRTAGTIAHSDIGPKVAARINASGFFTADIEFETLPGGSKRRGSKSPGRGDLRVNGSTQGNAIYDWKVLGSRENTEAQTSRYARFDKTPISSKSGSRPLTVYSNEAFDAVEAWDRTYVLSQSSKKPSELNYYMYDKDVVKMPQVSIKPTIPAATPVSATAPPTNNTPPPPAPAVQAPAAQNLHAASPPELIAAKPASTAPGKMNAILNSPVTGFVGTTIAKNYTQPIAENIADRISTAAVNSILDDIGGIEPMSVEEAAHTASGQRSAVSGLLSAFPPGADIGVALVAGAPAFAVSEVAFKPMMVEYFRQFPTPADFFNKVYAGY